jgi:hypothetical protein
MKRSRLLPRLSLPLALALGCAALVGKPARLLEEGRAAVEAGQYETAWVHLKELRTRYPGRPEAAEAFPLAATALRKLYRKNLYVDPDSPWVTTEPGFVFDWLGSLFRDGEVAQAPLEQLMVDMPHPFFVALQTYAEGDERLGQWTFHAKFDNGMVERIRAERAQGTAGESEGTG